MPSGDAIQAYALIIFFYYYGTNTSFWLYFVAGTIISLSRVYLCCHYISDIIVGAVIGTLFTIALVKFGFQGLRLDDVIDKFALTLDQYKY